MKLEVIHLKSEIWKQLFLAIAKKGTLLIICFVLLNHLTLSNPKREVRAVWVSTIHNLDWPTSRHSHPDQQKEELLRLLNKFSSCHINTVFFQIRNAADAMYPSKIEPWSQWLTGNQGKAPIPLWDPLAFMITECHKRNIEFHAWFNLFRAVSHVEFSDVSKQHISKKKKNWCFQHENTLYLNPGIPEVRQYVVSVLTDVVKRYSIDGVHVDDYFYPSETSGASINDFNTFKNYNSTAFGIENWRRENINSLIQSINTSIKKIKPHVKFGVSPVAVWRHLDSDINGSQTSRGIQAYDDLYADIRKWLQKGWIDYVIPQLYHRIGHPMSDFITLQKWWSKNSFERHCYTGHALYKLTNPQDVFWRNTSQITNQLSISRKNKRITGVGLYKTKDFKINTKHIIDTLQLNYLNTIALPPTMPWLDSIPPLAPRNLKSIKQDNWISLEWASPKIASDGDSAYYYTIYRFKRGVEIDFEKGESLIGISRTTTFLDRKRERNTAYYYFIRAVDKSNNESLDLIGTIN